MRSETISFGKKKPEYDLYAGFNKDARMRKLGELAAELEIEAAKSRGDMERDMLRSAASSVRDAIRYIAGAKR